MKNKITSLLTLLFPFFLFAQTVTVSEPLSTRNDQSYEIIGKLKDRFLLFRNRVNHKYEVQAFDEKMRLSWSKELVFDKKRPEVIGVVPSKNDFTIFYSFRRKGQIYIKVHKYDPGANLIDSVTVHNYGPRFNDPKPELIFSEDRSKILIYHTEQSSSIEAISFDIDNMKTLWDCKFSPDGLMFKRDYEQVLIADDGTMYFILGKNNRRSKKEDHVYDIYIGNQSSNDQSVPFFSIPMQNFLTYDIFFAVDNLNHNIVAGGLYSEKNRGRAKGHFYLNISPADPNSHKLIYEPFDDEFVSNFLGKHNNDKENKGITETDIQDIVLRRDGGILIVGERNKFFERRMTAAGRGFIGPDGNRYIMDHHYDDLFVISVHPNGETHWKTILHKRQYSQDDDAAYSSYFLLKTPSNLRLLFNDEIKYENTVSEYVLRGDGEYDRNSVLSTESQKLRLRFRDAIQVGSNELIIPSERRNRLKLVNVKY